jgi:hypothetical protein
MKEQRPKIMKLFGTAIAGIMIATSLLPAYAGDDDRRNQSNNTNTQTNTQNTNVTTGSNTNRNRNNNNNTNTVNATGGTNTNNVSNNSSAYGGNVSNTMSGGSVSNSNTNNYIGYPDWINVAPSQSSVSVDSVTCQGPTLTATASTLTTNSWSNQYGVQGALGFSVPIGGQTDCNAVQSSIRKRASVENSVRIALACKQLEVSGIQIDTEKFPELQVCLAK